jgi:hypothetical protein
MTLLARLARNRWNVVTRSTFLYEALREQKPQALQTAILASAAVFAGDLGGCSLHVRHDLGESALTTVVRGAARNVRLPIREWQVDWLKEIVEIPTGAMRDAYDLWRASPRERNAAVALFLLAPDPLVILADRLAGVTQSNY